MRPGEAAGLMLFAIVLLFAILASIGLFTLIGYAVDLATHLAR